MEIMDVIKEISKFKFVKKFIFTTFCVLFMGFLTNVSAQNKLIEIDKKEITSIKVNSDQNKMLLCIELDAGDWKSDEDFFKNIGKKMNFPKSHWNQESWCLDEFEDLMTNLMWTGDSSIVIIIKNLSMFNQKDREVEKNVLIECFQDNILPFWEGKPGTGSVVDCLPCMKPKQFNVYYT